MKADQNSKMKATRKTKPVHVQDDKHLKMKMIAAERGVSLETIVNEALEKGGIK